jgi:lipid-binding SYLF domain-containing protein
MKLRARTVLTGLSLLAVIASSVCAASSKAQLNERADHTLTRFYALNAANKSLSDKAAGVLVFPRVTKGGVGVAGEFGEGVLQVNGETVAYYSVGSASVGLTLGVGRHSEIILFETKDSLDKFRASQGWSVGADGAVAVVKEGAGGQYDSATVDQPILGFIFRQKGLIGDLSLEGSKITRIKTAG